MGEPPLEAAFAAGRCLMPGLPHQGRPPSELRLRIVSALVLVVLAGVVALMGGFAFALLWTCAGLACLIEWGRICEGRLRRPLLIASSVEMIVLLLAIGQPMPLWVMAPLLAFLSVMVAATPGTAQRSLVFAGALYCAALPLAVIALRGSPLGLAAILWLFAIVWSSDIAAFFVGRRLGGPKLAPRISPGKTWSGFIGGTAGGTLMGSAVLPPFGIVVHWQLVALAMVLSVCSAVGDLAESALKRRFAVKDSGRWLPGHGGLLDRLDGFIAAAICAAAIGYARNSDPAVGLLTW